jgi:hypothetical protein
MVRRGIEYDVADAPDLVPGVTRISSSGGRTEVWWDGPAVEMIPFGD